MDRLTTILQYFLGTIAIICTAGVLLFATKSCTEVNQQYNQLYFQNVNNCTNAGGTWINTDPNSTRGMCVKSK